MRIAYEKIYGSQNHAGRADAALRAAVSEESLLNGVKMRRIRKPFDRTDFRAIGLQRGYETAVDERAIDFHGASTAFTFAAAFFSSGKVGLLTQHIQESRHRPGLKRELAAIDFTLNTNLARGFRHARA